MPSSCPWFLAALPKTAQMQPSARTGVQDPGMAERQTRGHITYPHVESSGPQSSLGCAWQSCIHYRPFQAPSSGLGGPLWPLAHPSHNSSLQGLHHQGWATCCLVALGDRRLPTYWTWPKDGTERPVGCKKTAAHLQGIKGPNKVLNP